MLSYLSTKFSMLKVDKLKKGFYYLILGQLLASSYTSLLSKINKQTTFSKGYYIKIKTFMLCSKNNTHSITLYVLWWREQDFGMGVHASNNFDKSFKPNSRGCEGPRTNAGIPNVGVDTNLTYFRPSYRFFNAL